MTDTLTEPSPNGTEHSPAATGAVVEPAAAVFSRPMTDKILADPALTAEIEQEWRRRFPGYQRAVAVTALIVEGAVEACPRWANDHKHMSVLVRGWTPGPGTGQFKAIEGTRALVQRIATDQYHGAPGVEALCASHLLRIGLRQSVKRKPLLDPVFTDLATMLSLG
jgi:hypothetical protein